MARIQYQGLAEPLKQTEVVAETVTVDKWIGSGVAPQPNWQNKLKNSVFMAVMPTLFFTNVFTVETTTPDKYVPKTNEPVRTVKHQEYSYPSSFIDVYQLTLSERTTPDKWYQEAFLPPKGKIHLEYTFPSEFRWPYPIGTPADIVSVSVHQTQQLPPRGVKHTEYQYPSLSWQPKILINTTVTDSGVANVIFYQTFQYQKLSEPYEPSLRISSESVTVDKWFKQLSEPRRDVKRNQFIYPTLSIDPSLLTQAEVSSPDKWTGYHPDFIWNKKHFEFTYPSFFVDSSQLTLGERLTMDKWYTESFLPPKGKVHNEYQYPSFFSNHKIIISPQVVSGQMVNVIFYQTFQYQRQAATGFDNSVLSEQVGMDKWFRQLSIPSKYFEPKQWKYLYRSFFTPERGLVYIWTPVEKPETIYSVVSKPSTTWTKTSKPSTSYTKVSKPSTSYSKVSKPTTTWTIDPKTDEYRNIF